MACNRNLDKPSGLMDQLGILSAESIQPSSLLRNCPGLERCHARDHVPFRSVAFIQWLNSMGLYLAPLSHWEQLGRAILVEEFIGVGWNLCLDCIGNWASSSASFCFFPFPSFPRCWSWEYSLRNSHITILIWESAETWVKNPIYSRRRWPCSHWAFFSQHKILVLGLHS